MPMGASAGIRRRANPGRRADAVTERVTSVHPIKLRGEKWWQDTWLYRNSLSLAFILLFAIAFSMHVVYGHHAFNEQRALLHQRPIGLAAYLISSKLWSDTFECWQAEFFVMWFFLIASIYLRQEYSAESKPLGADVNDTGEPNE